jgi:hypothetical protein
MPALGAKRTALISTVHKNQTTNWTKVGSAASLETIVQDANAATLVKGPGRNVANSGQFLRLFGADVSIAANERVTDVSVRFNGKNSGSTDPSKGEFRTELVRGLNYHPHSPNLYRLDSTLRSYQGTWWRRNADNELWTEAKLNDSMVFLWDNTPSANTTSLPQISEVFLDYIVATQPTLTGLTVLNASQTTKPEFDWTWNSTDGYGQSALHVKVFSDTQYNAVGFDPDKSVAEYDSGVVSGSVEAFIMSVDLRQNISYKVYVQAALNLPDWGLWFSPWVNASFTIALVSPPKPVLTPQAYDNSSNRQVVFLQGRNNVLVVDDAGFDNSTGNWQNDVNETFVRDTAQFFVGPASLKLTATAGGDMSVKLSGISAQADKTFGIGFRVRPNAALRTARALIEYLNGASAVIGTVTAQVVEGSVAWSAFTTAGGAVPAGTASIRVILRIVGALAGESHWFDNIMVCPGGAPIAWAPGSIEGGARYEMQVSDMPAKGNLFHPNIASGGEYFGDIRGFYTKHVGDQVTVSTEIPPHNGLKEIRWVPSAAGSELHLGCPSDGATGSKIEGYPVVAVPGKTYGGRVRVRVYAVGPYNLRAKLIFLQADGTHQATIGDSGNVSVSGGGAAAHTEIIIPDTVAPVTTPKTIYAKVIVENAGGIAGFPNFVDMPEIYEVSGDYTPSRNTPGVGTELMWSPWRGSVDPETGAVDAIRHINDFVAAQEAWLIDYEVPTDQNRLYRIRDIAAQGGTDTASDWEYAVAFSPTLTGFWLKDVFDPSLNFLAMVNDMRKPKEITHAVKKGVFPPVAGGKPIVVTAPPGGKSFSFELAVQGDNDWFKFLKMLENNHVILIQSPTEQWYAHITNNPLTRTWSRTTVDMTYRSMVLEFVEVDAP